MTPDTIRDCFRRTGFATENIQSASPDGDGIISELRQEITNVPDTVLKGVSFEDFLSVNNGFAVIMSPGGTNYVIDVMEAGAAESTEETANVTRGILSLFGALLKVKEALGPVDVLCQYYFNIEGHGLELVQTTSTGKQTENKKGPISPRAGLE